MVRQLPARRQSHQHHLIKRVLSDNKDYIDQLKFVLRGSQPVGEVTNAVNRK